MARADARRCLDGAWLALGMEREDLEIGIRDAWGGTQPLQISCADRMRHIYVVGQTGTGKSTLLLNIFAQDAGSGDGCALIDPHGDLALQALDMIPRYRVDDVVIVDPTDVERPVGFNPFFRVPQHERALAAANITAMFKHIWYDSWGPRLEYILYNTVAALLDAPDHLRPSFLGIPLVLVRKGYREQVVANATDTGVRRFFEEEFETWNERQRADYLGSVQNKIGQLLANPSVRNILGQWNPSVDVRRIIEEQRILIVRLSKGTLGEEPANLLGSLIVSEVQQAAMRRSANSENERRDFHLIIDEFQNFTTRAFAGMLSEIRKYRVSVCVANQYLNQVSETVLPALFGNVGSLIALRVSAADAEVLARELGDCHPQLLQDLRQGEICVRLTANRTTHSFVGQTVPLMRRRYGRSPTIRSQARMRYGRDRTDVETRIGRWLR